MSFNNTLNWSGDYSNWGDALEKCSGYDDQAILDTILASVIKVKNGEAVFERDSVLFYHKEYSWPLLTILMQIFFKNEYVNIIDFGGSLGSTYFQNRQYFSNIKSLKWQVVEQQHFVEKGKKYLENNELKFFDSIEESIKYSSSDTILISSVLQYLPNPFDFIDKLISFNFKNIIIDRTLFVESGRNILCIQNVPSDIYTASYPCWLLSEELFIEKFSNKYSTQFSFNSKIDSCNYEGSYFKGFFLVKNA